MSSVNARNPWLLDDDRTLSRLYPTRGPVAAAKALGRSVKAVYRRAEKLGLRRVVPLHLARALVAEGVPRIEAARRLGVRAWDVQKPRRRPHA